MKTTTPELAAYFSAWWAHEAWKRGVERTIVGRETTVGEVGAVVGGVERENLERVRVLARQHAALSAEDRAIADAWIPTQRPEEELEWERFLAAQGRLPGAPCST